MTWKLPGYVVEERLGQGSTGEVWRASIARTGQQVALKRLPIADLKAVTSARAEAAVLSALDHPHLIRLHELISTSQALILVLDLADAGSLADLLRRRGRLTPGEVVTAIAPVGAALAYAHTQGIVHGDVSAGNVLFSSIGLPLLADLGFARIVGDHVWPAAVGGSVRATPAYLDPIVAGGNLPGPSSDVFSLAAVAVHALRGRPLWSGASAVEMIESAAAAGAGAPLDIDVILREVPASMRAVIGRALVADPPLRCTAAEFALDLRHSLAPRPVELQAGRAQPGAPNQPKTARHRSQPAPGSGRRSSFDRPAFNRGSAEPESPSIDFADGNFTHGTRLPTIERLPRQSRARTLCSTLLGPISRLDRRQCRIGLIAALAAVLLAGLVIGASALTRPAGQRPTSEAAPAAVSLAAAAADPTAPIPSSALSASPPIVSDAATAATTLQRLDQLRAQAFAERETGVLAQVYAVGALRDEDTATLTALVPAGCSLRGLQTTYTNVRLLQATAGGVAILATATLSPSTLTCGAAPPAHLAGASAVALRIELTSAGEGYRIADQQIAAS